MMILKDEIGQILKSRDKPTTKGYHTKHVNSPTKVASPLHTNEHYMNRNDSEEVTQPYKKATK